MKNKKLYFSKVDKVDKADWTEYNPTWKNTWSKKKKRKETLELIKFLIDSLLSDL